MGEKEARQADSNLRPLDPEGDTLLLQQEKGFKKWAKICNEPESPRKGYPARITSSGRKNINQR
jgi:hypothetical protein